MNDIIDIYEPVYSPPNYILIIIVTILIILIVTGLVLFLLKKLKSRTKTATQKYEETLDSFLFLKGEADKIKSKNFLIKCNKILLSFLDYSHSKSYASLTSGELMEMLQNYIIDKKFILTFFPKKYDLILYGKHELDKEEKFDILKNYGEIVFKLYKGDKHD